MVDIISCSVTVKEMEDIIKYNAVVKMCTVKDYLLISGTILKGEDPYLYTFQHIITLFIGMVAEQTIAYPAIER